MTTIPSYVLPGLESGTHWATNKISATVNFTFWTSTPSYDHDISENTNDTPFTPTMQQAVFDTLNMISAYCNVTFQQVPQSSLSITQIGYILADIDPTAEAYTYYPSQTQGFGNITGDVFGNRTYFTENPDGSPDPNGLHVVPGDYDYSTIIHETGHAMGLKHDFERPNPYPHSVDTTQYTIMSYTDSPFYAHAGSNVGYQPETYMPYDIAALQDLYGVNNTYHTGDDTYVLNPDHIYTIWDAGGNDTLDGSAVTSGMLLDLHDGSFSNVAETTPMTHNVAIAYNAVIENALGGTGDDTIFDNSANNDIQGNDGNDTIFLTTGADTADGGNGDDIFHLGTGSDIIDGGADAVNGDTVIFGGNFGNFTFSNFTGSSVDVTTSGGAHDTLSNVETFTFNDTSFASLALLQAGPPPLTLTGDALNNTLTGLLGNDTLSGLDGNDILNGGGGNDTLDGGTGVDRMFGGFGNDIYIVDNVRDLTAETAGASGGIDTVESFVTRVLGAGLENLILEGSLLANGTGNTLGNSLTGNDANNILNGSSGNDTLDGGAGHDTLLGGAGADTFVFHAATAYVTPDVVGDFKTLQLDKIDISDLLTSYDPLTNALSDFVNLTVSGRTTILSVDADGLGSGSGFQAVATLNNVTTLPDVDTLVANGNLIV